MAGSSCSPSAWPRPCWPAPVTPPSRSPGPATVRGCKSKSTPRRRRTTARHCRSCSPRPTTPATRTRKPPDSPTTPSSPTSKRPRNARAAPRKQLNGHGMSVSISPPGPAAPARPPPREPSLADALAPVVVLIGLLVLTIVLFGTAAADGPLQVALFMSATFAGIIAYKNGYTAVAIEEAAVGGVSSAMGAIFILLAVGALIGTWNLAGTIPTIVDYGLALLRPAIFFAIIAVICALVGAVTGSSWTTAATLGVAFVGMAPVLKMPTDITAGAVISGAYMGDKMSPLSETTILVPSLVGGVTVNQH